MLSDGLSMVELEKLTGVRADNIRRTVTRFLAQGKIVKEDTVYNDADHIRITGWSLYTILFNANPTLYARWMQEWGEIPTMDDLKLLLASHEDE